MTLMAGQRGETPPAKTPPNETMTIEVTPTPSVGVAFNIKELPCVNPILSTSRLLEGLPLSQGFCTYVTTSTITFLKMHS